MFDKALESIKSIKLTGGIFGKTNLLLMVLCVSASAVCIKISVWWVALPIMLLVIGLVFYALKRCFDFADSNPQAAIMDGAELLVHERMVHATKGNEIVKNDVVTIDHPQPPIDASEVENEDVAPTAVLESVTRGA